MQEAELLSTCLNCKRFDEASETCGLATPPSRPPARVIAFGCQAFDEDDLDVQPVAPGNLVPYSKPEPVKPRPLTGFENLDDDIPF